MVAFFLQRRPRGVKREKKDVQKSRQQILPESASMLTLIIAMLLNCKKIWTSFRSDLRAIILSRVTRMEVVLLWFPQFKCVATTLIRRQ